MSWVPPADAWETTNVGRFGTLHGLDDLTSFRERSIADPEWFWPAVVDFLDLRFSAPWKTVLDSSRGIEWPTWFDGSTLNVADICCDRWSDERPGGIALRWGREDGASREVTWRELRTMVDGLASLLSSRGISHGDAVGIYLPMTPEAVAALLAIAKIGAVFLPLFSGYAAGAIESRLADAGAVAIVTRVSSQRRGKAMPMVPVALAAADRVPSVASIICVDDGALPNDSRVVPWDSAASAAPIESVAVPAEHTLFVAYTSGTTGRPKGSVHVHGGFTVKIAEEVAFQFDCRRDDTLFWFTDMGWIMGQWEIVGALANGATLALYEGAPDFPDPGRLWRFVEECRATILGISPTLVRALMGEGEEHVRAADLSRLRILGSTGEPWNEAPWRWYSRVVGGDGCPVINISGGTEVGACFLSPHPVEPIAPMSLGGPSLAMAVDVVDDAGRSVRGQVGELVCRAPWPGMTRGLYNDPARYIEAYWEKIPGMWVHGDWASVEGGQWFLHGRSDDTIKVAGKRLGPAEVESLLVGDPSVREAAAVGVPDDVKGEALWCFVVPADPDAFGDDDRVRLTALVADALGSSFRPSRIVSVPVLPKTRSQKVVRRAIRSVVSGTDPGDLSSLEDPASIDAIRTAVPAGSR